MPLNEDIEEPIGYVVSKTSHIGYSPLPDKVRLGSYDVSITPIYIDTDVEALEEDCATLGRTRTWAEAVTLIEEWAALQHMRAKRGENFPD